MGNQVNSTVNRIFVFHEIIVVPFGKGTQATLVMHFAVGNKVNFHDYRMSRKTGPTSGQFTTPEVAGIVDPGGWRWISLATAV